MEPAQKTFLPYPVAKPVALLPRHWSWLDQQSRSVSTVLRRIVDEARRDHDGRFAIEAARERCYFLMRDLAGDSPGFEEACRALYAGDAVRFARILNGWPAGIRHRVDAVASEVWSVQDHRKERT